MFQSHNWVYIRFSNSTKSISFTSIFLYSSISSFAPSYSPWVLYYPIIDTIFSIIPYYQNGVIDLYTGAFSNNTTTVSLEMHIWSINSCKYGLLSNSSCKLIIIISRDCIERLCIENHFSRIVLTILWLSYERIIFFRL